MTNLPEDFEAAKTFFLEGIAEAQCENWKLAEVAFRKSLKILPDRGSTISNLLGSLIMQEKFQEAWQIAREAIELDDGNPATNINIGILHHKARDFQQALVFFDKAIGLDVNNAEAHLNRGKVLLDVNDVAMATESFNKALQSKPDLHEASFCKSLALLVAGDFENGWTLYEHRWRTTEQKQHIQADKPLWLGKENLKGKTILLHWEQGLGDTIQFSRFSRDVKKLGCDVVLKVQPTLVDLLKGLEGVDFLIADGSPSPPFDYYCPLMSLPLALGIATPTIPCAKPYLKADPAKIADWSNRLGPQSRFRIGIVWSGSASHPNDHDRSIPLRQFLAAMPKDCELISLQKEVRDQDASTLETTSNVKHFGDDLKNFSDTAALCALVDEVVTVDTSVAHLAGALGNNVNTLVPKKPDFRWLLEGCDTFWYPTMSLFRQTPDRQWTRAFEEVKSKLISNPTWSTL